ncbi:MAG: SpoIID/LytB domain-containing protein [Cyanobacteria bacterium P01_B01_bin.77]
MMRLKSLNIASLLLSGVITTALFAGINRSSAQAETLAASASTKVAPKDQSEMKEEQKSQSANPTQPVQASPPNVSVKTPEPQTATPKPKAKKNSSVPERIEPFIQADAVALGQWLVTKTVKTLVANPTATTAKPAAEAKPATPVAKPAQTSATAQPRQQQPAAPRVAVQALPPEPSNNPTIDNYTEMRVALTKQASSVTVAASQGGAIVSTGGELLESLPANVGYQITADNRGLFVNGQPVPTAVWLEPDSGYVAVGDRWYRGRLLLVWQNGGVMAVNYVKLQEYLYSVVGAEMSASWSIEALKAQAVAARSYAIVHTVRHQGRTYDLDDTQRYQAYKGVVTEASSTHQAVHETAGEFISYGGGVVESLYAANQDIVNDAHSGYGMSQTGALDLAQQGYRYYEILSAYYPDTSVGRLDIGN